MNACLARIEAVEPQSHAWAYLDPALARRNAEALDRQGWRDMQPDPILFGLPLGVKDVFNTADMPTEMGNEIWRGFAPGNDARVVHRARLLGAALIGKTTTAEFATHGEGRTINPHASERITGTSSGGSVVAVATGMAPAALATQTAGSIIRPASYCGIVGFKPSFGLIPRTGVLKTADTLDVIGWISRSVADSRMLLEAFRVRGHNYPVVERGLAAQAAKRPDPARPFRLALAIPPTWDTADPFARDRLVEFARQLGNRPDIRVSELDLRQPLTGAHDTLRTIYHKQLAYWFDRELKTPERVSETFRRITEEGREISTEGYLAAVTRQRELEGVLTRALADHDALISLSVAGEAPLRGEDEPDDPSWIWSLCGAPAITLPILRGKTGLPVGVQLVAPRYGDYALLDLAQRVAPDPFPIVDPVTEQE